MRRTRGGLLKTLLIAALVAIATPSEGRLVLVDVERDNTAGVDGLDGARGVAISPDGRHVYALGAIENTIAAFARSSTTGRLTFVQVLRDGVGLVDGLVGPTQLAVSPDGLFVYVVSGGEDGVAVFRRDPADGMLAFVAAYPMVGAAHGASQNATSIAISPDGQNAYVGAGNVLIVFDRDALTGSLVEIDVQINGTAGVTGMLGLSSMALTPDGGRLYGIGFRTFVTFDRDGTGALHFAGVAFSPSDVFSTGAVTVFANGTDIYATADVHSGPDHISAEAGLLRVGSAPGMLDVLQQITVGSGFTEPRAIAATADGAFVFVGSLGDEEIVAFRRASDGTLSFSQSVDLPLMDVFSIAASPDARNLYAVGANSDNLVAYQILPDSGPLEVPALSPLGVGVTIVAFAIALWLRRRTTKMPLAMATRERD